ncbi:hypothetical protein AGMMS4956_06980 [Bacteroidia bacterium]|nr:hypothetical protein AGMMS4956_06980 [Bacteroidia bacterium]
MKSLKYVMSAAVVCLVAAVSFVACNKDKDTKSGTPAVTNVSPTRVESGSEITILGLNLGAVTAVNFGTTSPIEVLAAAFKSQANNKIVVAVPAGVVLPCKVSVVVGTTSYAYEKNLKAKLQGVPEVEADEDNVVVVAYFPDACDGGEIVLPGSYATFEKEDGEIGWIEEPAGMVHFTPIAGWNKWYKAVMPINASSGGTTEDGSNKDFLVEAKPAHLRSNGKFAWKYQVGNKASVTIVDSLATADEINVHVVDAGSESKIYFLSTEEPVYLKFSGWKNGADPCNEILHDYTFTVTVPANTPDTAKVRIVGDFEQASWSPNADTMILTKGGDGKYTITLEDVAEGTSYKYVLNGIWDNEEVTATCNGLSADRVTTATTNVTDEVGGWKGYCVDNSPTHNYTFTVTVPASTLAEAVIRIVGGDPIGWDNAATTTILTKGGNGKYSITLQDVPENTEYKYILNGAWDTEKDAECANVGGRHTGTVEAIADEIVKWAADCP